MIRNGTDEDVAATLAALGRAGLEVVDWDLPFYDQGGTSLSFVGLIFELSARTSAAVPLTAIQPEAPLREIVDLVLTPHPAATGTPGLPIGQPCQGGQPTLSHPNRAWHLRLGSDDSSWTSVSDLYRVARPFDMDCLRRSVDLLVEDHDALRLQIRRLPGGVRETFDRPGDELLVAAIDLDPSDDAYCRLAADAAVQVRRSVSSSEAPFKVLALRHSGDAAFDLFFAYHHASVDRLSKRTVERRFFALYEQLRAGRETTPVTSVDYRGYCNAYFDMCEQARSEALSFWEDRRLDLVRPLPLSRPEHAQDLEERWTQEVDFMLDAVAVRALFARTAARGIRASELILCAIAEAWMSWTGDEAMLLAHAYHGRSLGALSTSATVGWLTDILPLHTRRASREDIIASVRDQMGHLDRTRAYNYLRFSERTAFLDHPWPDISLNMILDASESVSNYPGYVSVLVPRERLKDACPTTRRVHQISGGAVLSGKGLRLSWDFNGRAIDLADMQGFLDTCVERLTDVAWLERR